MKNLKTKVAGLVLALGVAGGLMAAPAFGAANFNANGANCHGVFLSNKEAGVGQIAKILGVSVKDLQGEVNATCAGP